MPRKKKPKAGDDGACPQCRKLVPLVLTDGGALVLRTHHVVATGEHDGGGYDVKECGSSGYPPAAPSEMKEGDDWQKKAPQRAGKPTAIGSTAARASTRMVLRDIDPPLQVGAPTRNTGEPTSLGEAIRSATDEIIAVNARTEDHTLTTEQMTRIMGLSTSTVPDELRYTADGGPRIADMVAVNGVDITDAVASIEIHTEPVLSLRDVCQRIYQELDPLLIRLTGQPQTIDVAVQDPAATGPLFMDREPASLNIRITARQCGLDVTSNIVPSAMTSEAVQRLVASVADRAREHLNVPQPWSTDTAGLVAQILTAVRETYIDVTGAPPPGDADISVSVEEDPFASPGMQTLRLRLRPNDLVLQIPVAGELLDDPRAVDIIVQRVTREVRRALLERAPGRSGYCRETAQGMPCACIRDDWHDAPHRCVCGHEWPEGDTCP